MADPFPIGIVEKLKMEVDQRRKSFEELEHSTFQGEPSVVPVDDFGSDTAVGAAAAAAAVEAVVGLAAVEFGRVAAVVDTGAEDVADGSAVEDCIEQAGQVVPFV